MYALAVPARTMIIFLYRPALAVHLNFVPNLKPKVGAYGRISA